MRSVPVFTFVGGMSVGQAWIKFTNVCAVSERTKIVVCFGPLFVRRGIPRVWYFNQGNPLPTHHSIYQCHMDKPFPQSNNSNGDECSLVHIWFPLVNALSELDRQDCTD
jgi:hypothetical protein